MNRSELAKQRIAARRQRVADVIAGIVQEFYLGAILFGSPGKGKSFEVMKNIRRHDASFALANSKLSGLGLYQFLEQNHNRICVIEDAEGVLRDKNALGVLRSATEGTQLGRDGKKLRKITYHSYGKLREFIFTGSVILTMNRGPSELPEAEALATRLQVIDYSPDEDEVVELMREICNSTESQHRLSTEERHRVTEFVIDCAQSVGRSLNLRMQAQAFDAFTLWDIGHSGIHWEDAVDSLIRRSDVVIKPIVDESSRREQMHREREIARQLLDLPSDERLGVWQELTGKSRSAMYRRIEDLGKSDNTKLERSSPANQQRPLTTAASDDSIITDLDLTS